MTNFDQSQHPRNSAGTSKGGQFAQKQNSAPEAELNAAPPSPEDAWRGANSAQSELEYQLSIAKQKTVIAGAKVLATAVRAVYPTATRVEVATVVHWDTPEWETADYDFVGVWDGQTRLADGEEILETVKVFGGNSLDRYATDLLGYETSNLDALFDAGDSDESGSVLYSINLNEALERS